MKMETSQFIKKIGIMIRFHLTSDMKIELCLRMSQTEESLPKSLQAGPCHCLSDLAHCHC